MRLCHIFAGGDIADLSFIEMQHEDMIICADRGYKYVKQLGIAPHIIVGDFDSYDSDLPDEIEIHRSVPEKDDTDTMLALKLAIERGADNVKIYGALGGRFDHTVANIQTLKYASEHGCNAEICDSDNIIMLQENVEREYTAMEGWYFSVFAYSPEIHIARLSGVKYPLEKVVIKNTFPLGVSNEIIAEKAILSIENGTALVVRSKM